MDLDLNHVRAFVLAVEELHFGRAAGRLSITQQALSKRIAALENRLGVRLLDRGGGVRLTESGVRFLDPARKALESGELAVAAVATEAGPLRVDVWGHLYAPMRTLAQAADRSEVPRLELGHGRDLASVVTALLGRQIDVGFGRVDAPLPEGLSHRIVRLEPIDAVVSVDHPLAGEPELRPEQLHDSPVWMPGPLDRLRFMRSFIERFGIERHIDGVNLGLDRFANRIAADPTCFSLFPPDSPLPEIPGIRSIPLVDPTPLYAWSLVWRRDDPPRRIEALLAAFDTVAQANRWLEHDPDRDWLPEP